MGNRKILTIRDKNGNESDQTACYRHWRTEMGLKTFCRCRLERRVEKSAVVDRMDLRE